MKTCKFCGEDILDTAIKCKHCGEFLDGKKRIVLNKSETPTAPVIKSSTPGKPTCQQCGGAMVKKTVSSGNCSGIVVALIVFCVGVFIAIILGPIGWILGPIICIGSLFMGGKRSKVWKCSSCSSVVPRA